MKAFFRNIAIFSGILVILFLSLTGLYVYQFKQKLSTNVADIVFLGDSHFQGGINSETYFKGAINYSNSGESYFATLTKLEYLLKSGIKIEKLCLAYSGHNISQQIDSLWVKNKENFLAKYRVFFPAISLSRISDYNKRADFPPIIYLEMIAEIFYQSLYSLERQVLVGQFPYLGGYEPNNKVLSANNESEKPKPNNLQISSIQIYYLSEIVRICKQERIELFYINVPLYYDHKLGFPNAADKSNYGTLLDYGDLFKGQSQYFADYVHLNSVGANVFTKKLSEDINKSSKSHTISELP